MPTDRRDPPVPLTVSPSRAHVLPRAWRWTSANALSGPALLDALRTVPPDDLLVLVRRWRHEQRLAQREVNARPSPRTPRPRAHRAHGPAPIDPTSTVATPAQTLPVLAPAHALLDRVAALAANPGWATDPDHPAWAPLLDGVLLGASPVLPLLAALHLDHAPLTRLLVGRGGMRRLNRAYPVSKPDEIAMPMERWLQENGPGLPVITFRMIVAGSDTATGKPTLAHALVQRGDPAWLRRAFDAGLDAQARTSTGMTLAHTLSMDVLPAFDGEAAFFAWSAPSADRCLAERLQALQEAGLDLNAPGPNGDTVLHLAVRAHDRPLVEALIHAGVNHQRTNHLGETPAAEIDRLITLWSVSSPTPPGLVEESTITRQHAIREVLRQAVVAREQQALAVEWAAAEPDEHGPANNVRRPRL